jgi:hypothetical protein
MNDTEIPADDEQLADAADVCPRCGQPVPDPAPPLDLE